MNYLGGQRPDTIVAIQHSNDVSRQTFVPSAFSLCYLQRQILVDVCTNLQLDTSGSSMGRDLHYRTLKRNDLIVAFVQIHLSAPMLAPPSYMFIAHHIALVHSFSDQDMRTIRTH